MKLENINISAIKYFIDTVELQSLTKAADKNFVSRPAISQSIKRLEDWSGRQLITHDKRIFELTDEGQNLFRLLKSAYCNFQATLDKGVSTRKSLKLGTSASLIDRFVAPSITKLSHVDKLNLKIGTTKQLHDFLESEEINIAVSIDSAMRNKKLSKVIYQGNFIVVSPEGKKCNRFVVTEDRPEVLSFKKSLGRGLDSNFIKVESWTTGLKIARALNIGCLVPDILLEPPFKKISMNFKFGFKVILEHRPFEYLSDAEISFVEGFVN